MAKKKLIQVRVGFKYSYAEETPDGQVIHVKFPEMVSNGDSLKGRGKKNDKWWFDYMLKEFHEFKEGQIPDEFKPKDFWIQREYK